MAIKQKDIRAILENEETDIDGKIRNILNLVHTETDALRDANDAIQRELDTAKTDLTAAQSDKEKAEQALTDYKNEQSAQQAQAAKEKLFREAIKTAGVNEKRIDTVLRAAKADGKLDAIVIEDGKIKDAETVTKGIKDEWADFIVSQQTGGASTSTPPSSIGGATMTKEQIAAIKDPVEQRKAIMENAELFGIKKS